MNESTDNRSALADYVVVGTGSAGSVLAERLSADARNQVVVVEAGGKDTDRRIHMPATWMQLLFPDDLDAVADAFDAAAESAADLLRTRHPLRVVRVDPK